MKWFVSEEELKRDARKSAGRGILLGSILGGLAVFFLTPMKGKEAREKVSQSTKELSQRTTALVKENAEKLSEKTGILWRQFREQEQAEDGDSRFSEEGIQEREMRSGYDK